MEDSKNPYRIYKNLIIEECVQLSPQYLDNHYEYILNGMKKKENKCNKFGYIHKILKIININEGIIYESDFSGDVIFKVQYEALICSPKINDIIECSVLQLSTFQNDIIAQQGPLFIVVIFDKIKDKACLKEGDKILVCINGYFGLRFKEMCERNKGNVITIEQTWGKIFTDEQIQNAINEHSPDLLFNSFCEILLVNFSHR